MAIAKGYSDPEVERVYEGGPAVRDVHDENAAVAGGAEVLAQGDSFWLQGMMAGLKNELPRRPR